MIFYFIQIVVFQLLVLGLYDLVLKKETFFQLNRAFLLITPLVIMVIPFLEFSSLQNSFFEETIVLPELLIAQPNLDVNASTLTIDTLFKLFWLLGSGISLLFFLKKLHRINYLKKIGEAQQHSSFKVVTIPDSDVAFTFLNTIFLGAKLTEKQREEILIHEIIHVNQNHTLDLLFYELLKIVFWFNPLFYLFQNRLAALQEFIADANVVKTIGKSDYYQSLLSKLFQTEKISFINTFFNHSLIKKRIIMLQKSKSSRSLLAKYLLIIPLLGVMVIYSSCINEAKGTQNIDNQNVVAQVSKEKEFNFKDIEKVPTYPGCENLNNEEAKKCFTQNVAQLVMKEFNSKISNDEIKGRQRIVVNFVIDANGDVKDITAKADFKELQDEAIRVAKKLPKMIPGEHKGKKVAVQFALPILFEI